MCRAPSGLHHPLLQRAGIGPPQWTSPPFSSLTASKTYATFPDGHVRAAAARVTLSQRRARNGSVNQPSQQSTAGNLARTRRFGRAGEFSRAAQALCPDPLATTNDATEAILRQLHPLHNTPLSPGLASSPILLTYWQKALRVALTKAPRMVSGGPSGWLFEHLQDLFLDGDERSFSLFLSTCRHIARAAIPPRIADASNSSHLLALAKPTGGVRPIAMTEVVMRLVSKAVCSVLKPQLTSHLSPHQFGAGMSCGAEALVHGIRAALDVDPSMMVLGLDISNAFNTVERRVIMEELRDDFPSLISFFLMAYGRPGRLLWQAGESWKTVVIFWLTPGGSP
eukprot:SM000257S08650  [mRNA]  locus=s257:175322:176538:- [translate_table: standard]